MKELLIATTNPAKFAEYSILLHGYDLKLLSLHDVKVDKEAPEDAVTFEDNARKKAAFYFVHSGCSTLADDGGLEVDALGGAPGVMSHRWLGMDNVDDRVLAEAIVERMAGIDRTLRGARLRAAAALFWSDRGVVSEAVAEASIEGIVADRCHPDVRRGVPDRSVLFLPERGRFLSELDESEAAQLSQRRIIVEKLASELERIARG